MSVDVSTTVGAVQLANPVMTAAGTAGHGTELLPLLDLAGARGARGQVAGCVRVGRQPGATAARRRSRECSTRSGCRVRASPPGGVTTCRRCSSRHHHRRQHLGSQRRRLRPCGRGAGRAAGERRRRRGQPVVPQPRGSTGHLRPRPGAVRRRSSKATEPCGRPRWAKLSPNTDRVVDVAGSDARRPVPRRSRWCNTLLGLVIDRPRRGPCSAPAAEGYSGTPIHPVVVRTVFDVHARLARSADRRRRRDQHRMGRDRAAARRARAPCRWARRPSPSRRRRRASLASWLRGCQRHGVATVRELIGAAHP